MTPELRKMAEEAGICVTIRASTVEMLAEETLEAFAKLIAADCAKRRLEGIKLARELGITVKAMPAERAK